jgi:hypothetical protein
MTIIEATVVYNNIVTMINNDRDALTSYLMRLWFENTPMNEGPKTETDKLHQALGVVIEEYEMTHDVELLRMGATFSGILEKIHPACA